MSNIFSNAKGTTNEVETDYVGGNLFTTGLYDAIIRTAYFLKASKSDAMSVNFIFDVDGKELRHQIWVSNRNGEFTYKDKKTGDAKNLPGYSQMQSLALLAVGKNLGDLDTEELTVKIWNKDAGKELPQAVNCLSELHGVKVKLGIQEQVVDKTKDDGTGKYVPTGETRKQNDVIKFYAHENGATISEVSEFMKGLGHTLDDVIASGEMVKAINKMPASSVSYGDKWLESNEGEVYDKSSKTDNSSKSFDSNSSGITKDKPNLFD